MSVILVGKAPSGNFIVTDAMAMVTENVKSFRDCRVEDKISTLSSADCYCSLVGDATIVEGIAILDSWSFNNNLKLDFSRKEVMQDALLAAEKHIVFKKKEGDGKLLNDYACVYFVDKERVFEYHIVNRRNKYFIDDFRFFADKEIVINYASRTQKIRNFDHPNNRLFEKATEYINAEHRKSKERKESFTLDYDFDGRFCGVVFSKKKNEKEKFYSPFRALSEMIAADASTPKMVWKLIDDKKFRWSPEDGKADKSKL